jgi:hypothetical protein
MGAPLACRVRPRHAGQSASTTCLLQAAPGSADGSGGEQCTLGQVDAAFYAMVPWSLTAARIGDKAGRGRVQPYDEPDGDDDGRRRGEAEHYDGAC